MNLPSSPRVGLRDAMMMAHNEQGRLQETIVRLIDLFREDERDAKLADGLEDLIVHALRMAWLESETAMQLGLGSVEGPKRLLEQRYEERNPKRVPEQNQKQNSKPRRRLTKRSTPGWMRNMGVSL